MGFNYYTPRSAEFSSPMKMSLKRLWALWRKMYAENEKLVKRHPLLFNSVFYGGVYCASDISQQLVVTPLATGEPRQKFRPDSAFRCWVKYSMRPGSGLLQYYLAHKYINTLFLYMLAFWQTN